MEDDVDYTCNTMDSASMLQDDEDDLYEVTFDIHEEEWSFVENPPEDSICVVCKKLLKQPMLTECCGAHLCKECAEPNSRCNLLNECPVCLTKIVPIMMDKSKCKSTLGLLVHCPQRERGCEWEGELRASKKHCVECQYIDIECTKCEYRVQRGKMEEHLQNFCSKRPITCQYCGTIGEYHTIATESHLQYCLQYIVNCPCDCGAEFKQMHYDEHMEECPELLIPCMYRFAECSALLKRKDMGQHMQENLAHHLQLQSMAVRKTLTKSNEAFQLFAQESEETLKQFISKKGLENECSHLQELKKANETKLLTLKLKADEIHEQHEQAIKALFDKHTTLVWELDREQLQCEIARITSGPFTEVWKGLEFGYKKVAIKKQRFQNVSSAKFLQEALIMRELKHCNVIQLCGVCTREEPFLIVMEYMQHGNLLHYLRNAGKALTKSEQLDIIRQVASGMAYLQELNCLHRSVTSRSVLIGNDLRCKIGSFTLARKLETCTMEYEIPQGERMPIKWSAPEVLKHNRCSIKSDVWSFGVLQYEVMVYGKIKIQHISIENFIRSGRKFDIPINCPPELYQIMDKCWSIEPEQRPWFSTIVGLLKYVE